MIRRQQAADRAVRLRVRSPGHPKFQAVAAVWVEIAKGLLPIEAAEVVAPTPPPHEQVRFGTVATVRDEHRQEHRYAIVGVDEADAAHGQVSWFSPIALALTGTRVGDVVTLRSPRGEEELEVIAIDAFLT